MKDNLPKKVWIKENGIINLDNSSGPGTHWVSYCKKRNLVHYFDSFGVQPPIELFKYFGKNSKVLYSSEQRQKVTQIICGHLCLEFLAKYNGLY